jgi:hypothetical protein
MIDDLVFGAKLMNWAEATELAVSDLEICYARAVAYAERAAKRHR